LIKIPYFGSGNDRTCDTVIELQRDNRIFDDGERDIFLKSNLKNLPLFLLFSFLSFSQVSPERQLDIKDT